MATVIDTRPKESQGQPVGGNVCPRCGAAFACGMNSGAKICWCAELPRRLPVPAIAAGSTAACLCPECLAAELAAAPGSD